VNKKQPFARKTFYVRKGSIWVLQAIKALLKECDEVGIRCTDSDVIVNALAEYLHKYKKCEVVEKPKVARNTELKKTITCSNEKAWLFDRVDEIVRIKQAMGINTSFSYELCTLAISGLTANEGVGKINRDMLKNFKEKL